MARPWPREVLGEIALLDGGARTATVTLSQPSWLLVLARRDFGELRFLETVVHRLRGLDRDSIH